MSSEKPKINMNDILKELGQKKKTDKVVLDDCKYIYHKKRDMMGISHGNILQEDITPYFWNTLKYWIENEHNNPITVVGETTSGKSTVALAVMNFFADLIEKKYNKKIDRYSRICSDMIEFNRRMNEGEENNVLQTDEWSDMNSTSLNSSTETSMFNTILKMSAQRDIRQIFATPHNNTPYTFASTLILQVIGRNAKTKTTLCKLTYHDVGEEIFLPLGVVNIDVSKVLEADWYKKYREKKFKRLDLMEKHGVRDIRELENSKIVLELKEELSECSQIAKKKISRDFLNMSVKQYLQRNKYFFSIMGDTEIGSRLMGILDFEREIAEMKRQVNKPGDFEKLQRLRKMIKIYSNKLNEVLESEKKNVKILEEYNKIQ